MLRLAVLLTALSLIFAACGGDDAGSGGKQGAISSSDSVGGGARAMASAMEIEFTKLKDCYQGEKDGKAPCQQDLLTNRVTAICSAVRTGKANEFAVADTKAFDPVCTSWGGLFATPLAEKPDVLAGMIEKVKAIN